MIQITCIHREIELTFHVMFIKGLKCGPFEQDFTDFGWIFSVRNLGLEGESK